MARISSSSSSLIEFYRRQPKAFLARFSSVCGKAAGHRTTDIRPVTGVRQPAEKLALVEERFHELDIHRVGAAEIGIVDDKDVSWLYRTGSGDHCLSGVLHRTDKDRQTVLALSDQISCIPVIDAVGAVVVSEMIGEKADLQNATSISLQTRCSALSMTASVTGSSFGERSVPG